MSSADGLIAIGVGFYRTGTSSLRLALEAACGGKCYHLFYIYGNTEHMNSWLSALAKDPSDDELKNILNDFVTSADFPSGIFYKHLMNLYPSSKIILTVREPDAWYKSFMDTIALYLNSKSGNVANLVGGCIRRLFGDIDFNNKDAMIAAYNRYNEEVKKTVPADRLLVFDVADGYNPLCQFLGVPAPSESFPNVCTTEEFRTYNM